MKQQDTAFMAFWQTLNSVLKDREQPEMQFGEANGWWQEFKEKGRLWEHSRG